MLVALLAILTWAAPSTMSVGGLAVQEAVGLDGLGLVFASVGAGRKDLCIQLRFFFFENIANASVNCDEQAVLYFDHRPHG